MFVLSLSGVGEIVGYIGRIAMINNPSLDFYLLMEVLLVVTPNILAYVEYSTVGRIMKKIDITRAWGFIPSTWVSRIFVISDLLCITIQSTAAVYLSSGKDDQFDTGRNIMLVGLAIQITFFTGFIFLMTHVHSKSKGMSTAFMALYIQMGCLYARAIYRVLEAAEDLSADVNQNEYYFYIFDFLMVVICFVTYILFHFSYYLNGDEDEKPIAENIWRKGSRYIDNEKLSK